MTNSQITQINFEIQNLSFKHLSFEFDLIFVI